ncbi:MAG: transporter [Candidatus Saccharibacteria bacterium]|nr:transporter [Candidatus Saccharibacteria bacterium]
MANLEHSAHHHASSFTSRQRTIALVIVALAFVMDLLDTTIVNIAIPSIQTELGASYAAIQWITAGYALAFATLLITGGRLGDVVGYKKLFIGGVTAFTLASLLCGLSPNIELLIVGRLLQGAAAAMMAPQVMSLMQVMYKPKERAAVMGLFGALGGLSASLGPIIGGFLISWNIAGLDWRPIFLINIPVGIFAVVAGLRYLPRGKSPHPLKLDVIGTVLVFIALGLLVFPLIQGRELGWPSWIFVMIAASIPFFVAFWLWQLKKFAKDKSPLIIPSLFRTYSYTIGLITNIVFQFIMIGFFFTFTLTLQIGLGFDVIKAALTGLPVAIGIGLSIGVIAPKLTNRIGRYTMTLGTVVMSIGLIVTTLILQSGGRDVNPWALSPGLLLIGIGMGMIMGLMFSITLKDVPKEDAGSASGTLSAGQQVGGAIGIALVGLIFFGALSHNAAQSFSDAEPAIKSYLSSQNVPVAAQASIISGVKDCYVDRTEETDNTVVPESCKKLEQASGQTTGPSLPGLPAVITDATKQAASDNFANGFKATMIYALAIVGVTFILSFLMPHKIEYSMEH